MNRKDLIDVFDDITKSNNSKEEIWKKIDNSKPSKRIIIVPKVLKVAIIILAFLAILVPTGVYAAQKTGLIDYLKNLDPWTDHQIKFLNCSERFEGFKITINEDGTYRLYNEELDLELITDNSEYTIVNYNDKSIRLAGPFAYISGVGDNSDIVLKDITGDGVDELITIFSYGGTAPRPDDVIHIVDLTRMVEYDIEDISTDLQENADLEAIIDSVNAEIVDIIEVDGTQLIVIKITEDNGDVHYTKAYISQTISEEELQNEKIDVDYAKVEYIYENNLFNVDSPGFKGIITISACDSGVACVYFDIEYNITTDSYEVGENKYYYYYNEVHEDDFYINGYSEKLETIAEYGQCGFDVSYITIDNEEYINVYDREEKVGVTCKEHTGDTDYILTYDGKEVVTREPINFGGLCIYDFTGDDIPDFLYYKDVIGSDFYVYDAFNTGKVYEILDVESKMVEQLDFTPMEIVGATELNEFSTLRFSIEDSINGKQYFECKISNQSFKELEQFELKSPYFGSTIVYDETDQECKLRVQLIPEGTYMTKSVVGYASIIYDADEDEFTISDDFDFTVEKYEF